MGSIGCDPCPDGQWTEASAYGSTSCNLCGDHMTSSNPHTSCTCDIGYDGFEPSSGGTTFGACTSCALGYYNTATNGGLTCEQCVPGTYADPANPGTCLPCPADSWSSTLGATSCTPCDGATNTQGATGKTLINDCLCDVGKGPAEDCPQCAPGYINAAPSRAACTLCPDHTWTSSNQFTLCDICALGYYNTATSGLNCEQCLPGTYADPDHPGTCKPCPADSWSSTLGAIGESSCTPCVSPTNTQGATGKTSNDDCLCDVGKGPAEDNCPQCAPGTINAARSRAACTPCPPNMWTSANQFTSCDICAAGYHRANGVCVADATCTGNTVLDPSDLSKCVCNVGYEYDDHVCRACEIGSYKATKSNVDHCIHCNTGMTTASTASTSITQCLCKKGYGGSNCAKCDRGQYKDVLGSAACTLCPQGTYNDHQGQTSIDDCNPCPKGKWSNSLGASDCNTCPCGSVVGGDPPRSTCTPCPAQQYSNPTSGDGTCHSLTPNNQGEPMHPCIHASMHPCTPSPCSPPPPYSLLLSPVHPQVVRAPCLWISVPSYPHAHLTPLKVTPPPRVHPRYASTNWAIIVVAGSTTTTPSLAAATVTRFLTMCMRTPGTAAGKISRSAQ